jgi:transcriptional regulator with XRE-family HTH domain
VDGSDGWRTLLRDARRRLGVSQQELAQRAGLSFETVRGYENGRRSPRREHLQAVLDALKVERTERNAILEAAGWASDWQQIATPVADLGLTQDEAQRECARAMWPCFVMTEMSEVIVANSVATALWGVDLQREYTEVAERSMLAVASDPRFADRVANWDEAIGTLVSVFKGHYRGPEQLEAPSPLFNSILERFLAGEPRYVARFLKLWQERPPAPLLLRWHYPVVWQDPAGRITFDCVVSTANEREGWAFNDWIPVDAESWRVLEAVKASAGSL